MFFAAGHCCLGSLQPRSHLRSNQLSSRSTGSRSSPTLQSRLQSPLHICSSSSSSSSNWSINSSRCSSSSSLPSTGSIHQPYPAACSSSSGSRLLQRQRRTVIAAASAAEGQSSSSGSEPASSSAVIVEQDDDVSPFSEDDLMGMTEAESTINQDDLADAWRENFDDDLDGLYNYVDRCELMGSQATAAASGLSYGGCSANCRLGLHNSQHAANESRLYKHYLPAEVCSADYKCTHCCACCCANHTVIAGHMGSCRRRCRSCIQYPDTFGTRWVRRLVAPSSRVL